MTSKPLCLLALDGGGVRGLSELLIIEEIMQRIKHDLDMDDDPLPADFFDLIGGTSTGGARKEYVGIAEEVFSVDRFLKKSKFDGQKLEAAVKRTLKERLGDGRAEERMLDPTKPPCKVFVCTIPQEDIRARAGPSLFRTYNVRENATFNCTIWEASRATSAAPTYFDPISIGDPGQQEIFVDGGLGYNNPIEQVLEEAKRVFPGRRVACIVSIGTGLKSAIRFPTSPKTSPVKLIDAVVKMATESDTTAERVQVRFGKTKDTYFRFSVVRDLDEIDLAEWKNLHKVRTYTTGYMRQSTVSSRIDAVVKALLASKVEIAPDGYSSLVPVSGRFREGSSQERSRMLPWSTEDAIPNFPYKTEDLARTIPLQHDLTSKPPVWSVPFDRNPLFTGRESDLKKLGEMLFNNSPATNIAAITGLGGIGKTQLALALVYETKAKRTDYSVLWVPAATTGSIEKAYLKAAQELGIPGADDAKADVTKRVRDHLSEKSAGRWLLVFDNADDITMWTNKPFEESGLARYLPVSPYGSIVFTTRDKKAALALAHLNVVEILELDETGSKQLFRNYLTVESHSLLNNENDTVALLAELAYLPLAIVQAAAFINENTISPRDYLALLGKQEEDVIELLSEDFGDERRHPGAKDPVATTWLISFKQIQERDPLAAQYLSYMACVAAKDIPLSLLPPGSSTKHKTTAMGTLKGYSLIAKQLSADSPINTHRLVHLAMRNWLQNEGRLLEYTHTVMIKLMELIGNVDQGNRAVWRAYMPHVDYILRTRIKDDNHNAIPSLLNLYGLCLLHDGRYREAETQYDKAVVVCKANFGVDHPATLTAMNNLALTYWNQERWEEAEKMQVQVMEMRKKSLGVDHPDTLRNMSDLASTYNNQGRNADAMALMNDCVLARQRVLGPEHPLTKRSMATLEALR